MTMSAPFSYNRTMNKLLVLFHSIESRKQIPMAEKYANMLIKRTVEKHIPKDKTLGGYWEKETMQKLLSKVIQNNVYRLLEDERL
jgi:hypothetical protein